MNNKFALIGGDKRNILLANELIKNGNEVIMYGFEKENIKNNMTLEDAVNYCDYVICAIPFTRDYLTLNTPLQDEKIDIAYFLSLIPEDKLVFTGAIGNKMEKPNNFIDVYKTEQITEKSTIATVEGAIKIAIENTDISLYDSNILIIGYGKIGKRLATSLRNMGANITIVTKTPASIDNAMSDSFSAYSPFELDRNLSNKNIIFNTAEKIQIDKNNIDLVSDDCVYIELASTPFGINYDECINSNLKLIYGLSLPGIFSPKTIAIALYDEIIKYIKEMKK